MSSSKEIIRFFLAILNTFLVIRGGIKTVFFVSFSETLRPPPLFFKNRLLLYKLGLVTGFTYQNKLFKGSPS